MVPSSAWRVLRPSGLQVPVSGLSLSSTGLSGLTLLQGLHCSIHMMALQFAHEPFYFSGTDAAPCYRHSYF